MHGSPLLEVRDVAVFFGHTPRWKRSAVDRRLRAVDGVSLAVRRGESLGLVGESGCGKSTLARAIVGLVDATRGCIALEGQELGTPRSRELARRIQLVFQDPGSSLNPRMTVEQMLREVITYHDLVAKPRVDDRIDELLALVGLAPRHRSCLPRQLSGGQRQRVAIARALAVTPDVLIADEAVSALDVSIQASILNLLLDLQSELDLTVVFISHDLAVVRNVCDRVAVMYLGRVVEIAPTEEIFDSPQHPYTQALLRAVPRLDRARDDAGNVLSGEPPSPIDIPAGCRFASRCSFRLDRCEETEPELVFRGGHGAACVRSWEDGVGLVEAARLDDTDRR